jgi:hypothetical protein
MDNQTEGVDMDSLTPNEVAEHIKEIARDLEDEAIEIDGMLADDLIYKANELRDIADSLVRRAEPSVAAGDERTLDLYDEIECDLAYLFGRASNEGHEAGQKLAQQVKTKMQRARAALASPAVPEGYKLVPLEPTLEMQQAGFDTPGAHGYNASYRAMIEAAPAVSQKAVPAEDEDDEGEFEEPDHGETVLRVQEALGITRTGWVSPDVILHRIEVLQRARAAQQAGAGYCADCNSWGSEHRDGCKRRPERFTPAATTASAKDQAKAEHVAWLDKESGRAQAITMASASGEQCLDCFGTGVYPSKETCISCKGLGLVELETRATALSRDAAMDEALRKINEIRNSIVGLNTLNWSEHVYPLVAALDAAGYEGMEYPEARKYYGTLLERAVKAEDALAKQGASHAANAGEDTERVEHIEAWLQRSKERGFKWNSYDFVTDRPAREQLDAAIASSAAQEGK